jgi:hypothetical protein
VEWFGAVYQSNREVRGRKEIGGGRGKEMSDDFRSLCGGA